jgi:hypothetical protein
MLRFLVCEPTQENRGAAMDSLSLTIPVRVAFHDGSTRDVDLPGCSTP